VTFRTAFDADRIELQGMRQLDQRPFPLDPDFAPGFRERQVFKFLSHTGVQRKCPEKWMGYLRSRYDRGRTLDQSCRGFIPGGCEDPLVPTPQTRQFRLTRAAPLASLAGK
jgi:hypothetical protein